MIIWAWNKWRNALLYVFIGLSALLLDISIFYILNHQFAKGILLSNGLAMLAGMLWSFSLNAHYNFKTTNQLMKRFVRYTLVVILGYILGTAIIIICKDMFGFQALVGKLVSLPAVFLFQYLLNSRITFKASLSVNSNQL